MIQTTFDDLLRQATKHGMRCSGGGMAFL